MKSYIFTLIIVANSFLQSQDFEIVGPPNNYGLIEFQKSNSNVLYIGNMVGALSRSYNDGDVKEYLHPGIDVSGPKQIVVLNPDTSSIFFTTGGYTFRTTDAGENWVYEDGETYTEAYIVVNPLNENTIYKFKSNELFKSYNKGLNWHTINSFSSNIKDVKIAYADTSTIYLGTVTGLYKSTDAGLNWFNPVNFPLDFSPLKISVNYLNENTLYVFNDIGGYGLSISKDGGKNFSLFGPLAVWNFIQHPKDTLTFYFLSEEPLYYPYGLFVKSTDEGQTWFPLNEKFPKEILFRTLILNPVNAEELYVTSTIGTFKSTNGGNDWKEVFLSAEPVLFDYYVDANDKNKIITTNSVYGFKMTTDAGLSWFIPIIDTIPPRYSNVYYQFAFNSQNPNQGFLTSDQALYQTSDGGLNWVKNSFPYSWSRSIAISPADPNIILLCTIDSPLGSANLYLSKDGGNSWELRKELGGWYFGFKKMVFDPVNGKKIYLHMYQGDSLLVTTDLGLTWENAGVGLSNNAFITQIWINPNDPLEMYCTEGNSGTYTGAVSMSTNGGESWFQIDSVLKNMDNWLNAQTLWVDPENTNRIFIGLGEHSQFLTSTYTSGGIYFSDNHGQSWIKIFDSPANMIKSDNSVPRKLYFNTKYGLLRIMDTLVTDVQEHLQLVPNEFKLEQNYPNPFNPSTKISWQSPVGGWQTLKIYDILGREIATLVNEYRPAGKYGVNWRAANLPSGVYIYTLQVNGFSASQKMLFLK